MLFITCQPEAKSGVRVRRRIVVQVERPVIRARAPIRVKSVATAEVLVVTKRPMQTDALYIIISSVESIRQPFCRFRQRASSICGVGLM